MFLSCRNALPLFVCLGLLAVAGRAIAKPPLDLIAIAQAAESTSPDDARQISLALMKTPEDATLHAKLLGYYRPRKVEDQVDRIKEIVWMIDHCAADPIAGSAYCLLDAAENPEGYASVKAAWDRQFTAHADDALLLANGATFLAKNNFDASDSLLQQTIALQPKNARWPERLAQLYETQLTTHPADAAKLSAAAVQLRQSAYNLIKDPTHRFHILLPMPADALRGGDLIQAKRLAKQLLGTAREFKQDPAYGDAVHQGNIVLGETAFHAGNIDEAEEDLSAAAQTPGSPTLATTGPDFHLAGELAAHGERTAVHDYLIACNKFWPAGTTRLKAWTATLDAGGMPDF